MRSVIRAHSLQIRSITNDLDDLKWVEFELDA